MYLENRRDWKWCISAVHFLTHVIFSYIAELEVVYDNGLPVLTVSLPSTQEACQFTLPPQTSTIADFLKNLSAEDAAISSSSISSTGTYMMASYSLILSGCRSILQVGPIE